MNRTVFFLASLCLSFMIAPIAEARVDRVEILSRSDVLGGKSFGLAGPYEKLIGKVHFKVRPENSHNSRIVDLDKATPNAEGEVEFSADLYILKPKDANRGSGSLLIEIPNRGGKGIIRLMNRASGSVDPTTEAEFGDGFLMRHGITVVWVGWQFDVRDETGLMRLYAPIARHGTKPMTGLVRSDFMVPEKIYEHPLGHVISGNIGGTEYPVYDSASAL